MEDNGNYIYWIIVAIAAIVSLFGKKKKNPVSQNPKPTTTVPQDWEEVFGKLFDTDKPQAQPILRPVSQPVAKPKTVTPKSVYKPIPIPVDEQAADNEGIRAIKSTETAMNADIEEDTGGFSLEDISNSAEEWRKVFVYKEIFNRKY
jgi:hypothetical protein